MIHGPVQWTKGSLVLNNVNSNTGCVIITTQSGMIQKNQTKKKQSITHPKRRVLAYINLNDILKPITLDSKLISHYFLHTCFYQLGDKTTVENC